MIFFTLYLTQGGHTGQIPVVDDRGKPCYSIRGNLDNPNHTLYLIDLDGNEVGRLFNDGAGLIASYTIDIINHSLVHVKKINSRATNLFYVTGLNYWINGSIKNGSYSFRSGIKKVASVKTEVHDHGAVLNCNILRPEDVPFILLISVLFTQWHVTPLELPDFLPLINSRRYSTNTNFFKLLLPYDHKNDHQ